ncbi:hypothetical protein CDAR_256751 [Caerostris darwini]|uniref:Uncharacterized protein n=1 Tax=Caerostris darwini TaxID=1538125 RepID=A0AAV4PZX0_9ARAC|nr:hypothetical protein CDAR_256751 [Caerostris darwini]
MEAKEKKFYRGYSENDRGEVRTGIGGIQSISGPETIGCNVIVFTCTADDTILESWSADERKECTIWVLWGVLVREGGVYTLNGSFGASSCSDSLSAILK